MRKETANKVKREEGRRKRKVPRKVPKTVN